MPEAGRQPGHPDVTLQVPRASLGLSFPPCPAGEE